MDDLETQIHRTWVQLLVDSGYEEIASIAIDTEIDIVYTGSYDFGGYYDPYIAINIPTSAFKLVIKDEHIKKTIRGALINICKGRIFNHDQNGHDEEVDVTTIEYRFRVKLIDVEPDWQNVIRNLIANAQNPNQGIITEKAYKKDNKTPHFYNEMKFASKSEIRIAQEFERQNILFFPLPLAVRAETGNFYKDHKEVDFLVCHDGTWGILEVAYHPNRYEKDKEKDAWFKKSGILCVEHYTAERCYNESSAVVDEFLKVLVQHKR